MRLIVFIICIVIGTLNLDAQSEGKFYFYWGYNNSQYSDSDIHIKDGQYFDFTPFDVEAEDIAMTSIKDFISLHGSYNIRLGYYLNNKWTISFGLDHMRYVTILGQVTHISGFISDDVSMIYAGEYDNKPIELTRDLFYMEHTDGLNYLSTEIDYTVVEIRLRHDDFKFLFNIGAGAGLLIPKTQSNLLEYVKGNHNYHLSGYGFSIHAAPRVNLGKYVFIQATLKSGYINMPSILLDGNRHSPIRAAQSFNFLQWNGVLGFQFQL